MDVRVLLFASYADAIGSDSVVVSTDGPVSAADVVRLVQARITAPVPPRPMVAVNAVYAEPTQEIREGDEVAIIPPVAGG